MASHFPCLFLQPLSPLSTQVFPSNTHGHRRFCYELQRRE